ncbi:MAG: UDP-3-O-acyl-N-acetylglucosamine deacetylase [Gemmatimonadota bacterium]|nr:UDP-3-O-acyl-N-acetylglucosamine deacetylase [Gemmatimonadota bacterium]
MSEPRRSIAREATLSGTGVHTGVDTTVTFRPAESDTGLVFQRVDLPAAPPIAARLSSVTDTDHRVVLGEGDASVTTVEHLLAAVSALGIDDLTIAVDGPEVPIGDGSAHAIFEALRNAGTTDLDGQRVPRKLPAPIVISEGHARYVVAPGSSLRLTVTIDADHPLIGRQAGSYDIDPAAFATELASARTFGLADEAETLRARGLAQGASFDNTIVLSPEGLAGGALRWPDEFVRHKAVDLLGDLALLGGPLLADVTAFQPSHTGNIALARALERTATLTGPPVMDIQDILGVLPHRYPFLLVDKIVELETGKRIVGIKNVTMNEPFFPGHFPGHPVMPGVLIVEAMAQTGGMLLLGQVDDPENKVVYFMAIDEVKFRKPVVPGDQLRFELEMLKFRGKTCRMKGVAYVDGQPVAEAEMMAAIVDR